MSGYDHTFRFDELPKLQPDTMHWRVRAKYRRRWHERVWYEVLGKGLRKPYSGPLPPGLLQRARVTCVRHSAGEPDADNLAYSFKTLIDGFVKAGVLADDSPQHIESVYRWEKAKPKAGYVTVRIEEVEV